MVINISYVKYFLHETNTNINNTVYYLLEASERPTIQNVLDTLMDMIE